MSNSVSIQGVVSCHNAHLILLPFIANCWGWKRL